MQQVNGIKKSSEPMRQQILNNLVFTQDKDNNSYGGTPQHKQGKS